jgi:peptidoglycan/LPS O-acetylase OafA/YrhL
MQMQIKKAGFHTIDALRFFAFFKVYMLHVPTGRNFFLFSFLKKGGGIGVVFFFVLSGFLITYNLVTEQSKTGHVNLFRFFAKRVLRIWPLFYLFLLVLYLIPPHTKESLGLIMPGYAPDWRFSFVFLENYKIILCHSYPSIAALLVTWSLCVEEHFYIIWGILAAFVSYRRMWLALILLVVLAIAGRIICYTYIPQYDISTNEIVTCLDYFAIGGLLGYLYCGNAASMDRFILSIPLYFRITYIVFTVIFVFTSFLIEPALHLPKYICPTFESLIFAGMIAIVLPRKSEIRIGENNIFSYLGRISYGLYLFHPVFIDISLHYCAAHHIRINTVSILTLFIAFTLACTVATASLSYNFYEKPILRLKRYL